MKKYLILMLSILLACASLPAAADSTVYLDGAAGSDAASGGAGAPVKTFARALELLGENGTISVTGTVTVNGTETYTLAGKGESARVMRAAGFHGVMISVPSGSRLTLREITLDSGGDTSPNSNLLTIGSGSECEITAGARLSGSKLKSMVNGSVSNDGSLTISGGTITGGGSQLLSNTGQVTMTGGEILADAPPANMYTYAVTGFGEFTMTGGLISGTDEAQRIINQTSTGALRIGGSARINGHVMLSQGAVVLVSQPLDAPARIHLDTEAGLVSWAKHGATVVRPENGTELDLENFLLTAPGFALQKSTDGSLYLRDPALPDFSAAIDYFSFSRYDEFITGGLSVRAANNSSAVISGTVIAAFYDQAGTFVAMESSPFSAGTGETAVTVTASVDGMGSSGGFVRLFLWDSLHGMRPLLGAMERALT